MSRFRVLIFLVIILIIPTLSQANGENDENEDGASPPSRLLPFRNWPDEMNSSSGWFLYILYLVTTLISPLTACLCFCFFMCCGFFCFLCLYAPYGTFKHLFCVCCYSTLVVSVCVLTCLTISFSIWGGVSAERVKSDGVRTALRMFELPSVMLDATEEMEVFPDKIVSEEVDPIVELVGNILPALEGLQNEMNTTSYIIFESVPSKIRELYDAYEELKTNLPPLLEYNITTGINYTKFYFPLPEEVVTDHAEDVVEGCINDIEDGYYDLNVTYIGISGTRTEFMEISNVTMTQLRNATRLATEVLGEVLKAVGLDPEFFETTETVGTVVVTFIVFFLSLVYTTFCFLSVCGGCQICCCWQAVLCMALGSCLGSLTITSVASFHIFLFFAVGDVCAQGEYYTIRNVEEMEILNYEIPVFGNSTLEINALDLTRSILNCGAYESGTETYFDCLGLDVQKLNLSLQYEETAEEMSMIFLTGFNYTYLDYVVKSSIEFDELILIPSNFSVLAASLLRIFTNESENDIIQMIIDQGYNETKEVEEYERLNDILEEECESPSWLPINESEITFFSMFVFPFNVCVLESPSNETVNNEIVPLLKLYYNLTHSETLDALEANITNIETLLLEMIFMTDAILSELDVVHRSRTPAIQRESQIVKAWSTATLVNMDGLGKEIELNVDEKMDSMEGLECGPEGNFFDDLLNRGCGDMDLAVGLVGFFSLGLALTYFFMFWVQCYVSMMLRTKSISGRENNEDEEDGEIEVVKIEMEDLLGEEGSEKGMHRYSGDGDSSSCLGDSELETMNVDDNYQQEEDIDVEEEEEDIMGLGDTDSSGDSEIENLENNNNNNNEEQEEVEEFSNFEEEEEEEEESSTLNTDKLESTTEPLKESVEVTIIEESGSSSSSVDNEYDEEDEEENESSNTSDGILDVEEEKEEEKEENVEEEESEESIEETEI